MTGSSHPASPAQGPPEEPDSQREAQRLTQMLKGLQRHVTSAVMSGLQDDLQQLDLSFSQVTALHHLRAKAPLTVTQLSESTRLSLPATSHLTERLVKRGLVQRQENPDNRREKLLSLSDLGRHVVARLDGGFAEAYVTLFARLDPLTVRAAGDQMEKLLAELDASPAPDSRSPHD